mmetsp:Transcript_116563/g.326076  ORF Transcript_116563/g.326076 Transcript_116563/m.326076 type:complete len:344 (-) Transcript_116563:16-1047(-)
MAAARLLLCAAAMGCVDALVKQPMVMLDAERDEKAASFFQSLVKEAEESTLGESDTMAALRAVEGNGTRAADLNASWADALASSQEPARFVASNMTSAAQAARDAAQSVEAAKVFAKAFHEAKSRSRHYAKEVTDAAAAAAAAAVKSANLSVAGASSVARAGGHLEILDDVRLVESTRNASAEAGLAVQAARNAKNALVFYRKAEAEALDAAQKGLEIARQVAGKINLTVERSRSAVQGLAPAMAAEAKILADHPANGTASQVSMTRATIIDSKGNLVGSNGAWPADPEGSGVIVAGGMPTHGPVGPPEGAALLRSPMEIAGWVSFFVIVAGTVLWCSSRRAA